MKTLGKLLQNTKGHTQADLPPASPGKPQIIHYTWKNYYMGDICNEIFQKFIKASNKIERNS